MLFTGAALQIAGSPASIAGLPGLSFWVSSETSGPPLKDGASSSGSWSCLSPLWLKPQVLALSRLWPSDMIVPVQLSPTLLSTIVLPSVTLWPASLKIAPPWPLLLIAALAENVTLRATTVEVGPPCCELVLFSAPPLPCSAAFAVNALFAIVIVPCQSFVIAPPSPGATALLRKVTCAISIIPPWL